VIGALALTAALSGALSLTPATVERAARADAVDTVTIANNSKRDLRIAVTPRPWRQGGEGTVAADRRRTLERFVRVSDPSFRLDAGEHRDVAVTLRRVPERDSLYGALEVIGRPAHTRKGITVAYRLIGTLRYRPSSAARTLRLRAGAVGLGARGLTLNVRNLGNTIDPVGGDVFVSGPRGGRSGGIAATKILPGKSVHLPLMSLRGLRPGRYAAQVTLTQRGRNRVSVTRHFRIGG
jgi:hypothetical protein